MIARSCSEFAIKQYLNGVKRKPLKSFPFSFLDLFVFLSFCCWPHMRCCSFSCGSRWVWGAEREKVGSEPRGLSPDFSGSHILILGTPGRGSGILGAAAAVCPVVSVACLGSFETVTCVFGRLQLTAHLGPGGPGCRCPGPGPFSFCLLT